MRIFIIAPLLMLPLLTGPALAQDDAPSPDTQEKCRAQPDANGNPTVPGDNAGQQKPLDEALDECRGVLTPPPTGDGEITTPPPEGGKTPVITPPEMPEQQPSQ